MNLWHQLTRRFCALFRKARLDAEMEEEMRGHIELRIQANIEAGMNPEEARFAALRQFGASDSIKENCRDQRGVRWLEQLLQDIRFAARTLRKSPTFTAVVVLTLGLGIGANTSLFTAINAIILRPLSVPEPGRLVYVSNGDTEDFSYPFYQYLRDSTDSSIHFAATQRGASRRELIVGNADEIESAQAQGVTGNLFPILGVPASIGRTLIPEDDKPGSPEPVAVISHAFWQHRLSGDTSVIGRTVRLDDVSLTIIGVMPAGFSGFEVGANADIWYPVQLVTQFGQRDRRRLEEGVSWLVIAGRLRANATHEQAQAMVATVFQQRLEDEVIKNSSMSQPELDRVLGQTLKLNSGAAGYVRARSQFKQPLMVLMVGVSVVLLIACINAAGLLLTRGIVRQREFAVRTALGAGRGRIIRQLVTESLLLAMIGGVLGFLSALWGTRFLATYLAQSNMAVPLEPDARVLLFTSGISLLTGLIIGLAPALRLSRLDLISTIKSQGGATAGGKLSRLQPALVIGQVSLSLMLLIGAGLFIRTLHNLQTLDLGFRPDNLIAFSLDPGRWRPANPTELTALLRRVTTELEDVPGVRQVSVGGAGMLSGNGYSADFTLDGYVPAAGEEMRTFVTFAGPQFFETVRLPLLQGRGFTANDEPSSNSSNAASQPANVVILGETIARKLFGDANPIGRHVRRGLKDGVELEVIGVAKDSQYSSDLRTQRPSQVYLPFFGSSVQMPPTFYLRSDHSHAAITADIQRILARIQPQVKLKDIRTMPEVIDRLLVRERIITQLIGFFSVVALLLAALGIYGIISYSVSQRTREIGVRMALGATWQNVIRLVIRQGLMLAVLGCVLGVSLTLVLTQYITKLLYGIKPTDFLTFAAVTGLLLSVTFIACWLPARRAARINPLVALRTE